MCGAIPPEMLNVRLAAIDRLRGLAAAWMCATDSGAVMDPWVDCVARATVRLDDGKSDPLSIAPKIKRLRRDLQ